MNAGDDSSPTARTATMILRGCRDKEEPDVSRKQSGRAKEGFAKIVWALLAGKTKAIWSCDAGVLGCR
jgi:hypothetical protein